MLGRGNHPCTRLPLLHTTRATKGKHGATESHLSHLGPLPSPTPVAQASCRPGGPRCREGCVAGPGCLCWALQRWTWQPSPTPSFCFSREVGGLLFRCVLLCSTVGISSQKNTLLAKQSECGPIGPQTPSCQFLAEAAKGGELQHKGTSGCDLNSGSIASTGFYHSVKLARVQSAGCIRP